MASSSTSRLLSAFAVAAALSLPACGGGGGGGGGSTSSGESEPSGNFGLLSSTLSNEATWELNRLMEFEFNNRIDPNTVSFSTVQFSSPDINQPVTGSFEIKADGTGRTLVFRPHCPTAEGNENGSFVPGEHRYVLTIPTSNQFGADVLRDMDGRALTQGISRTFYSPPSSGRPMFVDYVEGPVALDASNPIRWPEGLNLFSDPDAVVEINFNQAIDARAANLNTQNLYILYADGEVGTAGEDVFPEANRLAGELSIGSNCAAEGATVVFTVSGILPPNRKLKVVVKREFSDIAGQENVSDLVTPIYTVPTLAEYFDDSAVAWDSVEVVDEISEDFESTIGLELGEGLPLPNASVESGYIEASFAFPGEFTTKDFVLSSGYSEIFTSSQSFYTDSANTTFTVQNGVLTCRDFFIEEGSELRARGSNPLIIYASGTVTIDGKLNVSGNNAVWPTGLNSPQRPEGGAKGEAGGGNGGTSSQEVFQETYRGSPGNGAFNFSGQGGQGGEGGFNQELGTTTPYARSSANNIAGGGGGGTFAITANVSPHWYRYKKEDRMPNLDKNYEPDHVLFTNTATDPRLAGTRFPYVHFGGEDGTRGSSWNWDDAGATAPVGVYGMEDEKVDIVYWYLDGTPADGSKTTSPQYRVGIEWADAINQPNPLSNDPTETLAIDTFNAFGHIAGHPTDGPDGGKAGATIFSNDGTTANDFWGRRINADGSVTRGELLVPWAGSGGGASGDMVLYNRDGTEPLPTVFPEPNFPNGRINRYRKGAPGGGGGGQLQILAIGDVVIGNTGKIWARGGNGIGGESIGWTYGQVSGSGGGSGGHIIVSTASKLDLSSIDIIDGNGLGDRNFTTENGEDYVLPISGAFFTEVFNAVGGRRGYAMSQIQHVFWESTTGQAEEDGNDTYCIGRGGAGSNGIIQIHVPNIATDVIWPTARDTEIRNYIHNGDIVNNDADIDRFEEILRIFAAPTPYALVPLFASQSMAQSKWVDTGLADLRQPNTGTGVDFPDYASNLLSMDGFDTGDGSVDVTSEVVDRLTAVVSGSTAGVELFDFEVRIPNASSAFAGNEHFLRTPSLMLGYVFQPNSAGGVAVEVASALYDKASDRLTLLTETTDGSMAGGAGATWSLSPRFFRLATSGVNDFLPQSANVTLQFQGAEESAPGSGVPGTPFPGTNTWTSNLSDLEGYRFIRYRVIFDIDAQGAGATLVSPRPQLSYIKIPFTW